MCRARCCRALGSPFPPSHPSSLPAGIFTLSPCRHTAALTATSPLTLQLVNPFLCIWSPLFLATTPEGGSWGSPGFTLAQGSGGAGGGISHPRAWDAQSSLPAISRLLPARGSAQGQGLSVASSSLGDVPSRSAGRACASPLCPSKRTPGARACPAAEVFRRRRRGGSLAPLSILFACPKCCRTGFVASEGSDRSRLCLY